MPLHSILTKGHNAHRTSRGKYLAQDGEIVHSGKDDPYFWSIAVPSPDCDVVVVIAEYASRDEYQKRICRSSAVDCTFKHAFRHNTAKDMAEEVTNRDVKKRNSRAMAPKAAKSRKTTQQPDVTDNEKNLSALDVGGLVSGQDSSKGEDSGDDGMAANIFAKM
jgi:hypothetical protein